MVNTSTQHPQLIIALMNPVLYDHPVTNLQLIETHISWVILTGPYAYKIKKPVNLGFLDFSTLEKRQFYCKEELRLNRRLAPEVYLQIVKITGAPDQPSFMGEDNAIEYAVKMVQFPQEAQLDRVLEHGDLQPERVDSIARMISNFHQQIEIADEGSVYGDPEHVYQPVLENFSQIRERVTDSKFIEILDELACWSESAYADLQHVFVKRKKEGFIRECHGDLHLRNLAWFNDSPIAFDCLEFNPELRWIDVISEVAFLVMDLQDHQQPQMAQRFLNGYLEYSGDYAGVRVLLFYLVYRALVRAKVDAIRLDQAAISADEKAEEEKSFSGYLELAQDYTRRATPQIIITRGLSASGKSTLTEPLLEQLGAIRIRSDVERKRIFGVGSGNEATVAVGEGIYSPEAINLTYDRLVELAGLVIDAGYSVIIDATFKKEEHRKQFRDLATAKKVPFVILEFTASIDTLRHRIEVRKRDVSDADLLVLEHQYADWHVLNKEEKIYSIEVNTEISLDLMQIAKQIRSYK